eukprot:6172571-Pleurochrysis_carterae.AAC.2
MRCDCSPTPVRRSPVLYCMLCAVPDVVACERFRGSRCLPFRLGTAHAAQCWANTLYPTPCLSSTA